MSIVNAPPTSLEPSDAPPGAPPGVPPDAPVTATLASADLEPVPDADPYLGSCLNGRYAIERTLGRGSMAIVYFARDLQVLSRPVVVKVLLDETFRNAWMASKFRQEIEALARLDHPGIVDVFDQGLTADERPFFVMQFIEGKTLRAVLEQGQVSLELASRLIRQIGYSLTAAHDKGVFHRDLKPENVMIQALGYDEVQVKVIDFGLARVENSLAAPGTSVAMLVGTIAYMAPEQLMTSPSPALSDIYSLAAMTYEVVTGSLPFRPSSLYELIAQQRQGPPILPRQLRPELPIAAEAAILQGLSFDPRDRPGRARDFADAFCNGIGGELEHLVSGHPSSATNPGASTDPPPMKAVELEPPGGAVPLHSRFYVRRPVDAALRVALERHDSIVLIKGARQVGKTSLLARGLQRARETGTRIVLTDFQQIDPQHLSSADALFRALAESMADQLELDVRIDDLWAPHRGANQNLERFLRRHVFPPGAAPLVWGMDEVDRLFSCPFGSTVFGLFRSWHNRRSLDPAGPWQWLTLAISYATEAHLFITDLNQSPFNVGTRLELEDFAPDQVAELNVRHGSPLRSPAEIDRLMTLLSGHPYLIRRALYTLSAEGRDVEWLEAHAHLENGPFGDHLRRLVLLIGRESSSAVYLRHILKEGSCPSVDSFYRLRSAGLIQGDSAQQVRLRCHLYRQYLEQHLQ